MTLSAVILAGGQSKRMGRDKACVRYEGKSLIQAAVERIRALPVDQIFISAREDQDFSHLNCRVLCDLEPGLGPLSGIERALRESVAPYVLVCPIDLPRMTTVCLHGLVDSCDRFRGAIAKVEDEVQPLVAVYPTRCHVYALNAIAKGNYAVHQFAAACLREKAIRLFQVPPWQAECFTNCNAPVDLLLLEAQHGRQGHRGIKTHQR